MTFRDLVTTQFVEVSKKYPDLALCFINSGAIVYGAISFRRKVLNKWMSDRYEISIEIPSGYPYEIPVTKETGGKVPEDFHTNSGDLLCLEVPAQIELRFSENPTLLSYIDNFVINYLTTYTCYRRTGKMPFGERAHGVKGKMQFYEELFNIKKWNVILDYLRMLANQRYRGHRLCYCGSGKRLRNCHRDTLCKWINADKLKLFKEDYIEIRKHLNKKGNI
jgi:hypothetical protein